MTYQKAVTSTQYYDEIAREIHELAGHKRKSSYKPSELVEGVRAVSSYQYEDGYYWGYTDGEETGWNDGFLHGSTEGYGDGLIEGEARGRDAQYNEFWDTYQKNPNQLKTPPKINYKYMFGGAGWNSKTFKPKYDMIGSSFERAFHSCAIEEINVTVDMSGIASSTGCNQTFYGATALKKISRFVPPPFAMANAFTNCFALEEIIIDGTITESISFSESANLNETSLDSIVEHLASVSVKKTLTLHATAKARLTDAQVTIIETKGWGLAW